GLIDTRRLGPRCYMRLTSIAVRLYAVRDRTFASDINMPSRDIQITEMRDTDATGSCDSKRPVHIREQLDRESASHKPDASHDINELSESIAKIFGRTYLEPHEFRELRRQLPIPADEITLVTRFYELPPDYQDFVLS